MMAKVPLWRCDRCKRPLNAAKNDGTVHFDYSEHHAYRAAVRAWEEAHPGDGELGVHTLAEYDDYPELNWHVVHDRCDHAALDRSDIYWIDVNRMDTWAKVAEWSAHLHGKDWFADTGWGQLLYSAGVATVDA